MIRPLLDLQDLGDGELRPLADLPRILLRDLAELGHRLAGERLDFEPDLEFAFVRPQLAHLWPRVAVDHARKLEAQRRGGKGFCTRKSAAPAIHAEATLFEN